ncbi:MAG: flippase-like domain-containing protein [Gemmatimonadota bacterium]|nr:flippase-like domain-containing protein [Gemmatimonadota bacterium]
MSGARGRSFRLAASIALALLLVLFARHADWRAAMAAARGADPRLLAVAFLCNQLSLVLKGTRWWVFLRPLGVRSLSLVLRATYAGASLNNLVVAQGGEAARVVLVSRGSGVAASRVASALALERVLDGVSYLVLLTSAAFLLDLPGAIARWRIPAALALLLSLIALVVLGAKSKSAPTEPAQVTTVGARVRMSIRRFVSSISETASPARLATALLLSLCAWALQVATYHTIARATHLPLSLAGSVAAMLAVGLSFLFRATPGNVGVFQAIYAVTVVPFGVSRPAAVATALLIQGVQIVPTVLAGTVAAHRLAAGRAS